MNKAIQHAESEMYAARGGEMNQVRGPRACTISPSGCAVQQSPERDKMHARPSRVQPCWQPKTVCVWEGGEGKGDVKWQVGTKER